MQQLVDEVRDGKLDFVLTKPEDAQTLISLRALRLWQFTEVISGAAVIGVGVSRIDGGFGFWRSLAFVALLLVGAMLYLYCFWLILATGFVLDREHVVPVRPLRGDIYQVGRWPIGIYPFWLRYSMTFLVPIGFAVTVPAQALTDRLHWETVVIALAFAALLAGFTRWTSRTRNASTMSRTPRMMAITETQATRSTALRP